MEKYIPKTDYNQILFEIVENNDFEALKEFLDTHLSDIDLNCKHVKFSYTALMRASESNYIEIVKILLETGCDKEVKDLCGNTALIFAVIKGNKEVVRILLEAGCDKETKNKNGFTPLMCTTCTTCDYDKEIAQILLEAGCDKENVNNEGLTAVTLAFSRNYKKLGDFIQKVELTQPRTTELILEDAKEIIKEVLKTSVEERKKIVEELLKEFVTMGGVRKILDFMM